MATISFKKEFKIRKNEGKIFVKVFEKKPHEAHYSESKFRRLNSSDLFLKVLDNK